MYDADVEKRALFLPPALKKEYKIKKRFIYRAQLEKALEKALDIKGEEILIIKFFPIKNVIRRLI